MDYKIREAIETNNLDVFRLLFDCNKILNDIIERQDFNDFCQLWYEIYYTEKFINISQYDFIIDEKSNIYVDRLNNMKNISYEFSVFINNNIKEIGFKFNKDFKFLLHPCKVLCLCCENNSVDIFNDYFIEITIHYTKLLRCLRENICVSISSIHLKYELINVSGNESDKFDDSSHDRNKVSDKFNSIINFYKKTICPSHFRVYPSLWDEMIYS